MISHETERLHEVLKQDKKDYVKGRSENRIRVKDQLLEKARV